MKKILFLASVALLAGCQMTPDYERPAVDMPDAFQRQQTDRLLQEQAIPADWWKNFNSVELNGLIDRALEHNNDIRAAAARVAQARANVKIARSTLYPQIGSNVGASRNYISGGSGNNTQNFGAGMIGGNNMGGGNFSRPTYTAGLDVSYEFYLLGGNQAGVSVAEFSEQASVYEMETVRLMTMAEVARTYFTVLNLRERIDLARNNLKNSEELLRIVNARYEAGAASSLEVAQQKSSLATTQATLTALERQGAVAEDALSVLIGTPVQNIQLQQQNLDGLAVPVIASYQPSQLLERRPDIRRTEAALMSANANIGVARAQYFPLINLSGGVNLLTNSLSDSPRTLTNLAAAVTAPIFSGGRLEGNVELSEARKVELIENYRKAVLVSLQEVEDALAGTKTSAERNASLKEAVNQARKAYDLSRELYKAGAVDFQTLLDSERVLIQTEDAYAQTRLENLSASIDLYRALGGGWNNDALAHNNPAPASSPTTNGNTTIRQDNGTMVIEGAKQNAIPATLAPPPATVIKK